MNYIAKQDDALAGIRPSDQREAVERIGVASEREEIAGAAVRPSVSDV
jgi:hypothetical protein